MLEVKSLKFSYDKLVQSNAIMHFDLTIKEASIAVIEGPSGVGKSTLLHLIAGFLTPNSGKILWQKKSISDLLPADRPVSMLFQNDNLFTHLDVWTNIAIGLESNIRNTPESQLIISQSLNDLGIDGMNKRAVDTLSGGQQQRVALARALVRARIPSKHNHVRRSLLLLDEPFSALDPVTKADCLAIVKHLVDSNGITALMVTHDPEDAKNLGAKVFSLKPSR